MIKCDMGECEMQGYKPIILAELSTMVAGVLERVGTEDEVLLACMIGLNHKMVEEDGDRAIDIIEEVIKNRR